jgi:hypothetical protein
MRLRRPSWKESTVMTERERRSNARDRVLNMLKYFGATGVKNTELVKETQRFGARILELRKAGYRIETVKQGPGIYLYKYYGAQEKEPRLF